MDKERDLSVIETFTTHITPYGLDRRVFVHLPDDWKTSGKRYPVIYMFDGHNLFFNETATYGTCWGLKDYYDAHPDYIVVGVECNHEGNKRLEEYCPYDSDWFDGIHGTGKVYLAWLCGEFKTFVDKTWPTLPDRAHTAIAGSSMGGLMSLYAVTARNDVFSRAGCLSPSVRLCMEPLLADLKKARLRGYTNIFFSWGEKETKGQHGLAQYTENALIVTRALQKAGAAVYPYLQIGGAHCEASWAEQVPLYMQVLFGEPYGEETK